MKTILNVFYFYFIFLVSTKSTQALPNCQAVSEKTIATVEIFNKEYDETFDALSAIKFHLNLDIARKVQNN